VVEIKPEISIFIPVYNEEKSIEGNIKLLKEALKNIKKQVEIIIVDDTSTDKTPEIAKRIK